MTTLLTTLLSGFWRLVRRLLRREHPLHVTQKYQKPIIPIKNTIRMILHKNLTHIMMILWKLQCTTMRTMPWQGRVRMLPCGLNSLSTGHFLWQTPPPMPIMKTSENNWKPFMEDSSTSTPSNGFKNQSLQNKKGFIHSVFSQAVILYVQTLETSINLCFWRQELIWTQEKPVGLQSVTRRSSSCTPTGISWKNTNTKLLKKLVIKLVLFDKIVLFKKYKKWGCYFWLLLVTTF